jgi:hypothetical protein
MNFNCQNGSIMKKCMRLLLMIILVALATQARSQQVEYHYFETQDSVRIEYRWARANLLNRNSDAVLYLQVTNMNPYPVAITYSVGFYRDNQLFLESAENKLCLNPGQRRRGSKTDMRFSAEGINMAMIEEKWFSWDVFEFDVEEAECE